MRERQKKRKRKRKRVERGKAHPLRAEHTPNLNRKIRFSGPFYSFMEALCRQNHLGSNYLRKHRNRSKLHQLAVFVHIMVKKVDIISAYVATMHGK